MDWLSLPYCELHDEEEKQRIAVAWIAKNHRALPIDNNSLAGLHRSINFFKFGVGGSKTMKFRDGRLGIVGNKIPFGARMGIKTLNETC